MYSEREIQHKVETAVKSVVKSDSDTITPKQLTDVLTKVLSSCLLSTDFSKHIDQQLGRMETAHRRYMS